MMENKIYDMPKSHIKHYHHNDSNQKELKKNPIHLLTPLTLVPALGARPGALGARALGAGALATSLGLGLLSHAEARDMLRRNIRRQVASRALAFLALPLSGPLSVSLDLLVHGLDAEIAEVGNEDGGPDDGAHNTSTRERIGVIQVEPDVPDDLSWFGEELLQAGQGIVAAHSDDGHTCEETGHVVCVLIFWFV